MPKKNDFNKNSNQTEEFSTEPLIGVVSDCLRLNIRKEPKIHAEIACVVNLLTELTIDLDRSTGEWYSVRTESGVEGFCMKKFVAVRR